MEDRSRKIAELYAGLRKRSGVTMKVEASALGLSGPSSVQRYGKPDQYKGDYLPWDMVAKLLDLWVGKGDPPISQDEVLRLGGPDQIQIRRANAAGEWSITGPATKPVIHAFLDGAYREDEMEAPAATAPRPTPNASFPPRYQAFPDDVSIPLRGKISAGPNGRFIMNGQDIARVFCPPGLEGVEGAYAVQIEGTSGEPRFFSGETAWINPAARYRQGDDVIVQVMGDDGDSEMYSYIKRYVSEGNGLLRLYQYNPGPGETNELEFQRDKVFSIHKVVFHAML